MIRTLWIVISLSCVAVIVSEVAGAGVLWSRGFLTARRMREIREVFEPQEKEASRSMPKRSRSCHRRRTCCAIAACGSCR